MMKAETVVLAPPAPDEYTEFYAGYVARVHDEQVPTLLARQVEALRGACADLSEHDALHRYAPGKWSIKGVIGHLIDSERVFAYRAFRIGRSDATPLAGFDENFYVEHGGFDQRTLRSLLDEWDAVRMSTISMIASMPAIAWERKGTANGKEISTRAIVYVIAGHAEHHLEALRERYGLPVRSL